VIWAALFVPVGIVAVVHLTVEAEDFLSVGEVDDLLLYFASLLHVGSDELESAV